MIGRYVRECQPLTKEIAVRGHLVANHTDASQSFLAAEAIP